MDLTKVPKQFCENINVGFTPEFFVLGLVAGDQGIAYALTPQHMKRLQQYLTHQITDYETKFGSINAQWQPGIQSPIQTKDVMDGHGPSTPGMPDTPKA